MRRQGLGQALVEYVVLLAMGSLIAIGTVSLAGNQLSEAYSQVSALIANPAAAIVPAPSPAPTTALPQTGPPTPGASPIASPSPTPTPDTSHETGPDAHANAHAGGNGHSHN